MSANPVRTCIECRTRKSKHLLQRLVVDEKGLVVFDRKQSLPGRGAYICFNDQCMKLVLKRRDLHRIFKKPVKGINLGNRCTQREVTTAWQK